MSGLDSRYITGPDLQEYFPNKSTGAPLAGGKVYFYKDSSRNEAKPVYELVQGSGNPQQYSYEPLPNPITLSAVGTPMNRVGQSVAIYYFPFDVNGEDELYYVEAYDALGKSQGVIQFTREAWPFPTLGGSDITVNNAGIISNQITNATFSQVLFEAPTLNINFVGNNSQTINIAPGWDLFISYSNNGSISITQNPVLGSDNLLNNPPFTLDFTMGDNLTNVRLIQKFNHNPDWAAANSLSQQNTGFLSGSMLLGPGTTVKMSYVASSGNTTPQPIIDATNTDDVYVQINNTIQLKVANSSDTGTNGYDQIVIELPITGTASISNIQVVSLNENVSNVAYEQTTSDRQLALMFNYFKSRLDYKPIKSYLVGWDFPLNPAQFTGDDIAAQPLGAAASYYAWDQTIIFQSVNNGVTISRDESGGFTTAAAPVGGAQLALIQYLPAQQAIEMLGRRKCVNISANGSMAIDVTVSLWYTTSTLPSTIGSNQSIVASLDAKGYPNNRTGVWTAVPRSGLSNASVTTSATNAAQVTINEAPTSGQSFNQIPLSGWDMNGSSDIYNATYFAIVIGTALIPQNDYIVWQAISCQDGDIATIPAPQSPSEVMLDCNRFWWDTFPPGVKPATQAGFPGCLTWKVQGLSTEDIQTANSYDLHVNFPVPMNSVPGLLAYNPINNNNKWYSQRAGSPVSGDSGTPSEDSSTSQNGFGLINPMTINDYLGNICYIHVSADARLAQ